MRQKATNFVEEWIADELLCKAPTGEAEAELLVRFSAEAISAGLSHEEAEWGLSDPDMASIIRKHHGHA
ncbi:MAG TPA: hypothetical protein VF592_12495 [Sphingomonas sp.]|jgi:hypothetical protein|uniref:hypothetical protein n=1 Tax=Sphingomonas sp. TaxID=28214 RepID=UPI002ED7CB2F